MIGKNMPHDRHLIKIIREAAKTGSYRFSAHATQRMKQRKISASMVLKALEKGTTDREPEPNSKLDSIEVKLNHYCAGVNYAVVVGIIDNEVIVTVVTVF